MCAAHCSDFSESRSSSFFLLLQARLFSQGVIRELEGKNATNFMSLTRGVMFKDEVEIIRYFECVFFPSHNVLVLPSKYIS